MLQPNLHHGPHHAHHHDTHHACQAAHHAARRLVVHSIKLPGQQGEPGQFRLSKAVAFPECRAIATLACANQFYSFVALLACSDRAVRVFDLNAWRVARELPRCHARTTHTLALAEGAAGVAHPARAYDLFLTAALADGCKLWDLRASAACVQKFDAVVNVRHQCGVALSPCLRFLACGGEDGAVTVFDTRRVAGPLARLLTASEVLPLLLLIFPLSPSPPSSCSSLPPQVVSDVAWSPRQPLLVAAGMDGALSSYSI